MKIYLVGGAVRDQLLGLPVNEHDWVVIGATAQEMLDAGYRPADADFPVFLHPETGEEYALARTETKTGAGYKGFVTDSRPTITLKQDLARRDLTINALVKDKAGNIIDHFQGKKDLDRRQLRHITPAFVEDPVRILRVARFGAHLGPLNFEITSETQTLMAQMSQSGDLQNLKPERVWQEMRKALLEPQPWRFFEVLFQCGALTALIPELAAAIKNNNTDAMPLIELHRVTEQSSTLAIRFAAAMYPAAKSVDSVETFCNKLRAEKECTDLLDMLIRLGPAYAASVDAEAESLLALLEQTKAQQQAERFHNFLLVCEALWPKEAKIATQRLKLALTGMNDIVPSDLLTEGYRGPKLGAELTRRRIQAIEKRIMHITHD